MDSFFPEDVIDTLSKTFWQRVSAMKGLIERHQSFRLLWFGEALKRNRNWTGISAEQAVNQAISESHGLPLSDVKKNDDCPEVGGAGAGEKSALFPPGWQSVSVAGGKETGRA